MVKVSRWEKYWASALFLGAVTLRSIDSDMLLPVTVVWMLVAFPLWVMLTYRLNKKAIDIYAAQHQFSSDYRRPSHWSLRNAPQSYALLAAVVVPPVIAIDWAVNLNYTQDRVTDGFNIVLVFSTIAAWAYLVIFPCVDAYTEDSNKARHGDR